MINNKLLISENHTTQSNSGLIFGESISDFSFTGIFTYY